MKGYYAKLIKQIKPKLSAIHHLLTRMITVCLFRSFIQYTYKEDNLTFLNAVNHFLAELITECFYFFFILGSADTTLLCHLKMKAVPGI